MRYYFCTCFDNNYLIYGYALYQSLKRNVADFILYIVCLDEQVYQNLKQLNLRGVNLIPLSDIEAEDLEYAATAKTRSRIEYIFTLSPVMPLYILKNHPEIDILAYMDSDLYFFSSPEKLYQELGNRSLLVFEHDFYAEERIREKDFGRFNMAFQLYRNDALGIACLRYWRQQCLDWCYDRSENGKYADQKYLEEWPERFNAVIASKFSGGGLAPWNCGKYPFDFSGNIPKVMGQPVVFYHYQGCKVLKYDMLLVSPPPYCFYIPTRVSNFFYSHYFRALKTARASLEKILPVERLQVVYRFERECRNISIKKRPFIIRVLSSIIFHGLLLLNGRLTYRGKRLFPAVFRILYYHRPADYGTMGKENMKDSDAVH